MNTPAPEKKFCSKCKLPKTLDDFHLDPSLPSGRRPWCRTCHNTDLQERKFRLPPNCVCEYCQIPFHEPPARIAKGRGRFCCRTHKKAFFAAQTADEKVCKTCGVSKSLGDFNPQKAGLYGRDAHCRLCRSKQLSPEITIDGITYPPMLFKDWYKLLRENHLKYCAQCETVKDIDTFGKLHSSTDGHGSWCIDCRHNVYDRDQPKLLASKKVSYRKNIIAERKKAKNKRQRYKKEKPEMLRRQEQINNARRRDLLAGTIHVDDIDLEILAERDHWICHICKKKVTRDNWSHDHLITVVDKGETSYLNVALAHVSCNSSRGPGRLPAQLRLFGLPPHLIQTPKRRKHKQ